MSQLQSLKAARSLHDIAALLQFKPSALAFILYRKLPSAKYHSFKIAKRGGGFREINAPSKDLMLLQSRLSDLLQDCVEEINKAHNWADQLAHGFKRDRSIITNASKHRKKRYVLNIDLADFFGTINFGRVRGFFIKERNFALDPAVATVLAQIACHENSLPQGSPCSPVMSNLIGHVLDIYLGKLAFGTGCTYSRYADDITFSTNKPEFPRSIAKPIKGKSHEWELGNKLQEIVSRTGFAVNAKKTRMQYRNSRQDVTGLVVNTKVNIRSEYRRTVRAMVHHLFTTGHFERIQMVLDASGVLVPTKTEGTLAQLHGMLGHIDFVDQHNLQLAMKAGTHTKRTDISSKEKLYRQFLMFKEFYAAQGPVIICEGKTDNVYLLHAIRSLAKAYPSLATVSLGVITLNVRLFKYSDSGTGRILQLTGGSGDFKGLIRHYLQAISKFKAPGKQYPVILLVDNDDGAQGIYSTIGEITKKRPTGTELLVHIAGNLYLVATPLKQGQKESVIEDAFTKQFRKLKLSGKSFSASNKYDSTKYYGKHIFSKIVERDAKKIDFSGFAGILTRLAAVIDKHKIVNAQP